MTYSGLIVGLGNPGGQYLRTRHNFGFMLADRLRAAWAAEGADVSAVRKVRALAEAWDVCESGGLRRWLLAKPQTYMNLSGRAVAELSRKNGISPGTVLIAHDELDLPLGAVRLKFSGGLAGHNGLKSIAASLGTRDFVRIRLGIGRPVDSVPVVDYVLRPFFSEEQALVTEALEKAVEAVLAYCAHGFDVAVNRLHAKG